MINDYGECAFEKADLYLDMTYDIKANALTIEDTNVKRSYIDDILCEWVRGQAGQGEDNRPAVERDVYRIRMMVDLSGDIFRVSSDTGNHGLTAGIIMTSIGKWRFSSKLEEELAKAESHSS